MSPLGWSLLALSICSSTLSAQHGQTDAASRPRRSGFKPSRQVVRPADTDLDGAISAAEWSAYVESLRPSDVGEIDPVRLRARVFVPLLDQTNDASLTIDDLFALFEALDKNVDLVIGGGEFPAASAQRASSGTGAVTGAGNLGMAIVVMDAADIDGDRAVSSDEWGMFVDGLELNRDDELAAPMLVRWMDATIAMTPEDGAPFSSGSVLRWVKNEIDADADGTLTVDDLQVFFDDLDKDANLEVAASELEFRFGRGRSNANDPSKPPLMPWQRDLDDALALCEATGKPLLICVNTEGEFASDSLATRRYRDPAFVELARGFVPLLVSPDRRNPRDHDDRGRRIPDERFGRVVNGEHIAIESRLYDLYFNGERVAPRHIGVAPNGKVLFDIFLVNDLTRVDDALREYGKPGPEPIDPASMTEAELLDSPDALHRTHLEELFVDGDVRTRVRLASLALSSVRPTQHPEMLRLGLADEAPAVRVQAAWTVARHPERASLEAFRNAFTVASNDANDGAAASALLGGLAARASQAPSDAEDVAPRNARNLHHAFAGAATPSVLFDIERWSLALSWADAGTDLEIISKDILDARLVELERRLTREIDDVEVNLAFAATALRYAEQLIIERGDPSFLLEDVVAAADRAAHAGDEPDGRALAFLARGAYLQGDFDAAAEHASRAVGQLLPWAGSRPASLALSVLAETRVRAVYAAMESGEDWPSSWVSDAITAHRLLLDHPYGNERFAATLFDFLRAIEVAGAHDELIDVALARYPKSGPLHAFLRTQTLIDHGAVALEREYDALDLGGDDPTAASWYAGLAYLMAAERHVENNEDEEALAAYLVSVDRFRGASGEGSEYGQSSSHYICLALAGAARLQGDRKEWESAVSNLEAGVSANPESVWETDGLGNTPRDTAQRLYKSLVESGEEGMAGELRTSLDENGLRIEG